MSNNRTLKDSDFKNGICTLIKNTPKLVIPQYNDKRFKIYENDTDETLYVTFQLNNEERALIGHECHKPKTNSKTPASTDLMCIYSKPSSAIGYAYDLKKTLGGKDVILSLVSQWAETLSYCKTQIRKTNYEFVVGVITEEFNQRMLNHSIQELSDRTQESDDSDFKRSSVAKKRLVSSINDRNILKALINFKSRKVEIEGITLDIDIHFFDSKDDKKEITFQFNGNIKPQVIRCVTQ